MSDINTTFYKGYALIDGLSGVTVQDTETGRVCFRLKGAGFFDIYDAKRAIDEGDIKLSRSLEEVLEYYST